MKKNLSDIIKFISAFVLLVSIIEVKSQILRILPLGNSITEGVDATPTPEGERVAYRAELYTLLTSAGYNFDFVGHNWSGYDIIPDANHGGIGGSRDQYVARLLDDGYDERNGVQITPGGQPYLDVYPADIILLHIGTNDLTHDEGTSAASVSDILDEIDEWELQSGNEVTVLVARIINRKTYHVQTTQYNNNVAAMVAARNDTSIIMVDMENGAGINYSIDIQDDEVHPKPSGYVKMGQKWFQAIQDLNTPPYFTSTPITSSYEEVQYSYTITADDDNPSDNLIFIPTIKPDWLTFTDNGNKTGLLQGTPSNDDVGDNPVSIAVTDGKVVVYQDFTIEVLNVNDPPEILGQNYIETKEDSIFTLSKNNLIIEDIDNDLSEIGLIVLNGDDYTFQDSTIIPNENYNDTIVVNIKVTDQISTSKVFYLKLYVKPVNDAPEINGQKHSIETKQYTPKTIILNDIYYSDIDTDPSDLSIIVLPDPDSVYSINSNEITPMVDTTGIIDVRVVLYDEEDSSDVFNIQVNVLPLYSPPEIITEPPKNAYKDQQYFYVMEATDPDEEDSLLFSANILPEWLNFSSNLKLLTGTPSEADLGSHWVALQVTDGRFEVEQVFQIQVKIASNIINHKSINNTHLIKNIYPIPANNKLNIILEENNQEYNIQIINIYGEVVENILYSAKEKSFLTLNINNYRPGIYFLIVSIGSNFDIQKFVIAR